MIFYTNHFIPKGSAACVRILLIPITLIRPEYKDDKGIHAHEQKHVDQAWESVIPILHGLRYRLSKAYRLACEVEAYREQLRVNALNGVQDYTLTYAGFIANDYNLSISIADACQLLKA